MKRRRRQELSAWLKGLLAVLLALQLGLAQASMAAGHALGAHAAEPVASDAGMPCHGEEAAPSLSDEKPATGSPSQDCCDPGSCHCAAVFGLPASPQVSAPVQPVPLLQAVPAGHGGQILIPDLRPPIR